MNIFPLGGHPDLQWLCTNVSYVNIPIEIWIQLLQNNFLGINDKKFFEMKYKIDYNDTIPLFIKQFKNIYKKHGILVFYKDIITRELWDTVTKLFKSCTVVGLTRINKTNSENILLVDTLDKYEQHRICCFLNKFLLYNTS